MDEKEAEARPLMGTIFLVYIHYWRASEASETLSGLFNRAVSSRAWLGVASSILVAMVTVFYIMKE